MQKIINGLTIANFAILIIFTGSGIYVWSIRDRFITNALSQMQEQLIDVVQYQIKQSIKIPTNTGSVLPFGK